MCGGRDRSHAVRLCSTRTIVSEATCHSLYCDIRSFLNSLACVLNGTLVGCKLHSTHCILNTAFFFMQLRFDSSNRSSRDLFVQKILCTLYIVCAKNSKSMHYIHTNLQSF